MSAGGLQGTIGGSGDGSRVSYMHGKWASALTPELSLWNPSKRFVLGPIHSLIVPRSEALSTLPQLPLGTKFCTPVLSLWNKNLVKTIT